jgi:hypothetical protein
LTRASRERTQFGEDRRQRHKSAFGFPAGLAHHQQVIRVADECSAPARLPCPVEPVQIDVAQDGRNHTALRSPGTAAPDRPILHHPGAQHRAHELQEMAVADPFLDRRHQPVMRNRLVTVSDVRLDHPAPALPGFVDHDLERVVCRAPGPKPKRARQEVGFEYRLDDDLRRRLHDPITQRRDRKRTPLLAARLRNEHPPRRKRPPPPIPQLRCQLVKHPAHAVLLDVLDGLPIDASRAVVGAHQLPRALHNIPAVDLVIERVEPSPGIGLGRPVKRSLQFSDLILLGGPSHEWHSPALPCA